MATLIAMSPVGIFFFLLVPNFDYSCSASILSSLSKYEVFIPNHLHKDRNRRDLSTKVDGGHLLATSFLVNTNSKKFHLDLYLNRDLLHPDYVESYQKEDGSEYLVKNDENCFYHGLANEKQSTFAAFSTCSGLRGIIHDDDGESYGVEPLNADDLEFSDEHILYNMRDIIGEPMKCGVNDTGHEHYLKYGDFEYHHLVRRAATNTEKKYIALAVVIDKRLYEFHGRNVTKVSLRGKEIANYVDGIYKTMNVRVPLVMLEVWNVYDLIHVSGNADTVLKLFQRYVSTVLVKKNREQDNAQLLNGIDYDGNTVGMAGIGTICGLQSAGINQDTMSAMVVANTVAHELGHNLGMHHDGGRCSCPNSPCAMQAYASHTPVRGFSSCSVETLDNKIKDGVASCLLDIPKKLYGDPVCGNGFLQDGEECDCGTEEECKNSGDDKCCIAKTCKLQGSAQCAAGPCCSDCQFKAQGTLCRGEMTECDLPEFCTGTSHLCPGNFYKHDGIPCMDNKAFCFKGGCRTHDEQCKTLWGKEAYKGADICFQRLNIIGDEYGNCGKDKRDQFIPCTTENTECGKLQCTNASSMYPIIGSVVKVKFQDFWSLSKHYSCRVSVLKLGKDLEDPSIVAEGTKCAAGKLCQNYTCTNVSTLELVKPCLYNCENGGICNNNGHCHCKPGYACPDCSHIGPGGSSDSGQPCYTPASALGRLSAVGTGLLVTFLLVIPLLAGGALCFRFRERIKTRFQRTVGRRSSRFSRLSAKGRDVPTKSGQESKNTSTNPYVLARDDLPLPSGQQKQIPVTLNAFNAGKTEPVITFAGQKGGRIPQRSPPPPPSLVDPSAPPIQMSKPPVSKKPESWSTQATPTNGAPSYDKSPPKRPKPPKPPMPPKLP